MIKAEDSNWKDLVHGYLIYLRLYLSKEIIIMSLFYEDDIFSKQCTNLTYGPL